MHQNDTLLSQVANLSLSNSSLFDYQINYKGHESTQLIHVEILQQSTHQAITLHLCGPHLHKLDIFENPELWLTSEDLFECAIVDLWLKALDFLYLYAGADLHDTLTFDTERMGLSQTLKHLDNLEKYGVEIDGFEMTTSQSSYSQLVENSEQVIQDLRRALWKAQKLDPHTRRFLQNGQLPYLGSRTLRSLGEFNAPLSDNNIISLDAERLNKLKKAG